LLSHSEENQYFLQIHGITYILEHRTHFVAGKVGYRQEKIGVLVVGHFIDHPVGDLGLHNLHVLLGFN